MEGRRWFPCLKSLTNHFSVSGSILLAIPSIHGHAHPPVHTRQSCPTGFNSIAESQARGQPGRRAEVVTSAEAGAQSPDKPTPEQTGFSHPAPDAGAGRCGGARVLKDTRLHTLQWPSARGSHGQQRLLQEHSPPPAEAQLLPTEFKGGPRPVAQRSPARTIGRAGTRYPGAPAPQRPGSFPPFPQQLENLQVRAGISSAFSTAPDTQVLG